MYKCHGRTLTSVLVIFYAIYSTDPVLVLDPAFQRGRAQKCTRKGITYVPVEPKLIIRRLLLTSHETWE